MCFCNQNPCKISQGSCLCTLRLQDVQQNSKIGKKTWTEQHSFDDVSMVTFPPKTFPLLMLTLEVNEISAPSPHSQEDISAVMKSLVMLACGVKSILQRPSMWSSSDVRAVTSWNLLFSLVHAGRTDPWQRRTWILKEYLSVYINLFPIRIYV